MVQGKVEFTPYKFIFSTDSSPLTAAMAIFRRSLAEDQADIFNHTWSVSLLLVLAMVTWLLPLSPLLQPQGASQGPISIGFGPGAPSRPVPKFKATCWCPQQFTGSMVAYTQAACAGAYNLALQGIDPKTHDTGASVYSLPFDQSIPISRDDARSEFKPSPAAGDTGSQRSRVEIKAPSGKDTEQRTDKVSRFIHTKTPVALFVLAVCLKVPHLVWGLLSSLLGGINIHQTLTSAQAGAALDQDSRRQLHSDLAAAVAAKVRRCSWSAGSLYLLLKVLMCAAVLAELLVVQRSLLPEARSLEEEIQPKDLISERMKVVNAILNIAGNASTESTAYSNRLLLCDLPIRSLQNVQRFTIQCIFQEERDVILQTPAQSSALGDGQTEASSYRVLKMYETVFLVVHTFLVVLAVANFTSLLVWLFKLLAPPCRKTVAPDLDLTLDACLLLQMAQENAGPEVAKALAENGAWRQEAGGKETIALSE